MNESDRKQLHSFSEKLDGVLMTVSEIKVTLGDGEYRGALAAIRENTAVTQEHTTKIAVLAKALEQAVEELQAQRTQTQCNQERFAEYWRNREATCPVAPTLADRIQNAVRGALRETKTWRLRVYLAVLGTIGAIGTVVGLLITSGLIQVAMGG